MSDLISALSSWFTWLMSIVIGDNTHIGVAYSFYTSSTGVNKNLHYLLIIFAISPVIIMAVVGIWHRLIKKN